MTIDIEKLAKENGFVTHTADDGECYADLETLKQFAEAYAAKVLEEQSAEIAQLKAKVRDIHAKAVDVYVPQITELQSYIIDLLDALNAMRDTFDVGGTVTSAENNALHKADQALSKTPAQSLQEHDNEVLEMCAKVAESMMILPTLEGVAIANKIRALKGKQDGT